jgi:hypothetical protein
MTQVQAGAAIGTDVYMRMRAEIERVATLTEVREIDDQAEALRVYAARIGNRAMEVFALEARMRDQRRGGQILIEMVARGEVPGWGGRRISREQASTLDHSIRIFPHIIKKWEAKQWMRLARLSDAAFENKIAAIASRLEYRERGRNAPELDPVERITPPEIIAATLEVFGGTIDLNPCAGDGSNVPALASYGRDTGLTQPWKGKVFVNPPPGCDLARWIDRMVGQHLGGKATDVIALLPALTNAPWLDQLGQALECKIRGSLSFDRRGGSTKSPYLVFYMGGLRTRFIKSFAAIGPICERIAAYNPQPATIRR